MKGAYRWHTCTFDTRNQASNYHQIPRAIFKKYAIKLLMQKDETTSSLVPFASGRLSMESGIRVRRRESSMNNCVLIRVALTAGRKICQNLLQKSRKSNEAKKNGKLARGDKKGEDSLWRWISGDDLLFWKYFVCQPTVVCGRKDKFKEKKLKSLRLFKRILKYPPNPGFSCKLLTHYSGTISGSTYDKDKNEDRKIGANITDSPLSPFSPLTPG